MLESLVATILNRFLGSYVENFDPKQLNIAIWSGDVKLKNLKLKKESLEKFELPVDVKYGHLGELTLQIPWSNLKSKPVKIIIDDAYLLASPRLPSEFDVEEEAKREQRIKQQKLESLELITKAHVNTSEMSDEERAKTENFSDSLINKIVDNVQVTIRNIHFRYEDEHVFTEQPYAVGFTLEELSAVSADESWMADFISGFSSMARKLLTLKNLTMYWNTDNESIYNDDHDQLLETFKSIIEKNSRCDPTTQFVLKPVSGNGHLTVNKRGATESAPHYDLNLFFDEFSVDLDSNQYKDMLWTTSQIDWYMKTHRFRKLRPKVTIEQDPKLWLRYAFKCVYDEIHEKNYKWTWDYFKTRRDQRKAYVSLWKTNISLAAGTTTTRLTPEEQKQLDDLEIALNYDDIKFYRSIARIEYKKEYKALPKPAQQPQQQEGWFSSWWGGSSGDNNSTSNNNSSDTESIENLKLTEEQRDELYDAIEYDEQKELSDSLDIPRERVKILVGCVLQKGSFAIRNNKNVNNLAEFVFEGCKTTFYQRTDSTFIDFKLNEFRVEDGSESALYKHVVSVKPLNPELSHESTPGTESSSELEPFFDVAFESNPLDESADSKLMLKMNSMTIFHNPRFIEEIARFFKPPKMHFDTIGAIMNAAESTIQDFTKQTRIGLQYAFEEHKTLNCMMDLQAPLIIIPVDPGSWSSPVAILDAGHISIVSDLVDKEKIREVKDQKKDNYTEKDWEKLNSYMYDKFNMVLQDAQILIGPDIKTTIEQLHSEDEKPALILDHLTMKFLIELSIIPSFYDLPRMKIGGQIPRFKAMLNDYQYKIFMELLNTSIPNIFFTDENDETKESKAFKELISQPQALAGDIVSIVDEDSSKKKKVTKSAPVGSQASQQHQLEFNFEMDLIVITLSRCSDTHSFASDKLVDLIGEDLRLRFFKTETDMNVDVLLADLTVDDYIEQSNTEEFKKLISSKDLSKERTDVDDLFKVHYTRTQRLVQFKGETIECYDQSVDMNISDFKIVVSRKSLLTLLNYALNTFTDPEAPEIPADKLRHNNEEEVEIAPQHIDVNIYMKSMILIFNDDGIKLATLILQKADIGVFLLPEKMKVTAKLGGLSLHDDVNEGASKDSLIRKLINIEGNDLAELYYETFDPAINTEPYSSLVRFETGSMVFMFVEDAFTRIFGFLSQFQRMKYIYDRAREAALNQANNIEGANQMKFDILIRAPIFIFPKASNPAQDLYDTITVNLGEIYCTNNFKLENGLVFNLIDAGLRNTKVSSSFIFADLKQELEIIDQFDVWFKINYCDSTEIKRPSTIVSGGVTGKEIKLTQLQAKSLLAIVQSLPGVFSGSSSGTTSFDEVQTDATRANKIISGKVRNPSLHLEESGSSTTPNSNHAKLDFDFNIPLLALTLFYDTSNDIELQQESLSRFSLNDLGIKLEMKENGEFMSDLHIKSFVVQDIREIKDNRFSYIIPEVSPTDYQFMASVKSRSTPGSADMDINLAIDSPKVILAFDYLMALQRFFNYSLSQDGRYQTAHTGLTPIEEVDEESVTSISGTDDEQTVSEIQTNYTYKVNIVDTSVILLANPQKDDTEAVVFKIGQCVLENKETTSLEILGVGMFLCKMDTFEENRLRIIDDFALKFFMDSRGSTSTHFLTKLDMSIEPLLMRLSLRDIKLALEIFNRASAMYSKVTNNSETSAIDTNSSPEEIGKKISKYAPSIMSSVTHSTVRSRKASMRPEILVKAEKMTVNIQGLRLVLIGDVHELPVLDMEVKPFEFIAKNWSTDLEANTTIKSLANIFNYSTSSWEPLLDPWSFSLHVSKTSGPTESLAVDVVSRDSAEFTLTSRTVALLSNITSLLTEQEELKPRGEDAPYRIVNETGYDLNLWIDDEDSSDDDTRKQLTLLKNFEETLWSFEDWRKVRETLHVDIDSNLIGVELLDSEYEPVRKISLKSEGNDVFMLNPKLDDGYHNRLACEIILSEDKVKNVILKSTITVQNSTQTPILFGAGNYMGAFVVDRQISVPAGGRRALPIDFVYHGKFAVRPDTRSEIFGWSKSRTLGNATVLDFNWRSIRENDMVLQCHRAENGVAKNYYFRAHAQFDESEPLNQIYPHMNINISPPLEIENLLPFDIQWTVYQRGSRGWGDVLNKNSTQYIHVTDMNMPTVMKVLIRESKYGESKPAVIIAPLDPDSIDKTLNLTCDDGQKIELRLKYNNDPKSGLKISIYSPYLIVNRTGRDLYLTDGRTTLVSPGNKNRDEQTIPGMFSFINNSPLKGNFITGNLVENTVHVRVGDSASSSDFSIDKVGQSSEVRVPLKVRELENNIGIRISEGSGVYNLTKVITLTPRYIVRNSLESAIQIGKVGASGTLNLEVSGFAPLYGLPRTNEKSIIIGFPGSKTGWSAPFNLNDVGEIFVRVKKPNTNSHKLVRVVISTEGGTVFIDLTDSNDLWPYSIKNFSDQEFIFYQSDPYYDEDHNRRSKEIFKPIYYRIPPKSEMPYAWDFPSASVKEIVLRSGNKERSVQLAEIGALLPMKILPVNGGPSMVDLNVMADDITQSLVISNYDPKTSMYQLKRNYSTQSVTTSKDKFETNINDDNYYSSIIFRFEGMGISLINRKGQELCYTTLRGVELRYNESEIYQNISLKLKWFQIDNQLYPSIYPIIVYPTVVPKSSVEMNNHPVFSTSLSKLKDDSHGVTYIKIATLLLQELSIEIDEDFLFALLDFSKIQGASWNKQVKDVLWDENLQIPEPPAIRTSDDFYFENFSIQPLQFNLSFTRTERLNAEETSDANNSLGAVVNILLMAIGNINDAPLKMSSLFLENVRTPLPYLVQNVSEHYRQAFLYQVYRVLGSADVLGNPVGLFNNISSGVMDIFYEPYQGFIMTDRPQELGIGLAKGGLSFLKKSVFGFSDSFAKFTSSMAKGLTAASMDKQFQEKRRISRQKNKPKHALYGFKTGATSFVDGVASGFAGLATQPIDGASKEGAAGFFKGLGKGLIGLPTKTATGLFDFANNVSEGIRSTATAFDGEGLDKVRLSRFVPFDGAVSPYSEREAQGQYWLKTCDGGKFSSEKYLAHVMLHGQDHCCIISLNRIIVMSLIRMSVDWELPYEKIENIALERTGIMISLNTSSSPNRFIPISDISEKRHLYGKIAVAVTEYSKRNFVSL